MYERAWVVKIKVGKRYINGQGTIVYINYKESENRFYGAPHNIHAQIPYDKNGKRISQICEDGLNLVAPYKPKRRELKVGDEILFKVAIGKTRNDPQLVTIRGSVLEVGKDCVMAGDSFEWFAIHSRQIVRFLNKEKA